MRYHPHLDRDLRRARNYRWLWGIRKGVAVRAPEIGIDVAAMGNSGRARRACVQ